MKTEDRGLRIEDGRGGGDESPMYIDRSKVGENVESARSSVRSHESEVVGGAKFEYFRLKTKFLKNDGMGETRIARIDTDFYMGSQGVANDQDRCERCHGGRDNEGGKKGNTDKSAFALVWPYIF